MKLTALFMEEELVLALKEMGSSKALDNDDFSALLYQKYWHIVGKVVKFCLDILNNGSSIEKLNKTNIVLIPKIFNPMKMANF